MHQIPAAYATLDSDALARLVREEYGLDDVRVVLLRRAFNDNYRVTAGDERFILRVYLYGKSYITGPDDFRFELDLLDHLAAEGLGVATAVPRLCGDKLGALLAPEGIRHFALFRYAPGVAVNRPDERQTRALGELVARVHLAADRFPVVHPRHSLGLEALVEEPLARVAPYLAGRPEDWAYVQRMAERVARRLGALQLPPGGWGIIHGDPHAGNCHFDGDRPVMFDFDTCGYGWRAYDVAIFMSGPGYAHRDGFLEAYQSVRPFSDAEVAMLPTFMKARALWNGGDILTLAPIWGEVSANRFVREMLEDLRRLEEQYPE
ncbi:MAG TPA: phosphotransferase [Symbiobacteriaceae bacterium]|nr:phosphotransferase [Symbiobacteriaceae bacterium]